MLDPAAFAQFFLSGLTSGCAYSLAALAIVLNANASGVVNLAQGEYFAVGGLLLASLTALGFPLPLSLIVVALTGACLGAAQERLTVRPLQHSAHFLQITVTLGVAVAIRGAAFLLWGKDPLSVPGFGGDRLLFIAGAVVPFQALWVWSGTILMLAVTFVVLSYTKTGRAIRACSINPLAARLMGIDPVRMTFRVFAAAAAMSAICGALLAPLTLASWNSGLTIGLKGLFAAIFGGFRSPALAVTVGIAIGLVEAFVAGFVSSEAKDVVLYAALIGALLIAGGVFVRGRDRLHLGSST
jgi:branched-chain amino acid transport system permease protein